MDEEKEKYHIFNSEILNTIILFVYSIRELEFPDISEIREVSEEFELLFLT